MSVRWGKPFLLTLQVCGEETEIYFVSEELTPCFAPIIYPSPVFGKRESKNKKVVHSVKMIIFVKSWNSGEYHWLRLGI